VSEEVMKVTLARVRQYLIERDGALYSAIEHDGRVQTARQQVQESPEGGERSTRRLKQLMKLVIVGWLTALVSFGIGWLLGRRARRREALHDAMFSAAASMAVYSKLAAMVPPAPTAHRDPPFVIELVVQKLAPSAQSIEKWALYELLKDTRRREVSGPTMAVDTKKLISLHDTHEEAVEAKRQLMREEPD
jgi:hypothetical protein